MAPIGLSRRKLIGFPDSYELIDRGHRRIYGNLPGGTDSSGGRLWRFRDGDQSVANLYGCWRTGYLGMDGRKPQTRRITDLDHGLISELMITRIMGRAQEDLLRRTALSESRIREARRPATTDKFLVAGVVV